VLTVCSCIIVAKKTGIINNNTAEITVSFIMNIKFANKKDFCIVVVGAGPQE
jgi:hypothetical protein